MEEQNITVLNGIDIETEIPVYLSQDANKSLRINSVATGLEWVNEGPLLPPPSVLVQNALLTNNAISLLWTSNLQYIGTNLQNDGNYTAKRGTSSSDGYQFINIPNSGIFGIQTSSQIILRSDNVNRVTADNQGTTINGFLRQTGGNIQMDNDTLGTSPRIGWGNPTSVFITGDSTTGGSNTLTLATESQDLIKLQTTDTYRNIQCNGAIFISNSVPSTSRYTHICGGSSVYGGAGMIGMRFSSNLLTLANAIEISPFHTVTTKPFRVHEALSTKIVEVVGTTYTIIADTSPQTIYMRKSATANTNVTINSVISYGDYNPYWTLICDNDGVSGTFTFNVNVGSIEIVQFNNGTRSLHTTGSITLAGNTQWDFRYNSLANGGIGRMFLTRLA